MTCRLYFFSSRLFVGFIRSISCSFSNLDGLLILYSILLDLNGKYASVVWNSTTPTNARKLQRM